MGLGHEGLDVYRLAIEYVAWVYGKAETLSGIHRVAQTDFDPDETKSQQADALDAHSSRQ